jgi:hypothetical protein
MRRHPRALPGARRLPGTLVCMEPSTHRTPEYSRLWLGVAAGVVAVVALAGLLALEFFVFGPKAKGSLRWAIWVAAFPAYFLLQFFAEAVLEGFLGATSTVVKAIPFVLLALFYVAYFVVVA